MGLDNLGTIVKERLKGTSAVIVTDENVAPLYLERCRNSLLKENIRVSEFIVPAGEESKSGKVWLELLNFMAEKQLTRTDFAVALGGGVVGDLTGFAAATYLRGIDVVQIPTTLLAAVDSSVGGKTAINLDAGKNLAGAFHQPVIVLQDSSLLETLPEDIRRDGMAEVIKYGIIKNRELFNNLKDPVWTNDNIEYVIESCVAAKKEFVEEDEFDKGIRQMLNFGHTIGHAVEKASGYEVSHGSAVAKGMAAISRISASRGWCSRETAEEIENILLTYGFDLEIKYDRETLISMMLSDKKRKGDFIDMVVSSEIGKCELVRITTGELGELL